MDNRPDPLQTTEAGLIVEGFIWGFLSQSVPIQQCIDDVEEAIDHFEDMIYYFKHKKFVDGFKDGAAAFHEIKEGLKECENVDKIVKIIEDIISELSDPVEFVVDSAWRIFWHRREITHDVEDAIKDWDARSYFNFGDDIGRITAIVLESPRPAILAPNSMLITQ